MAGQAGDFTNEVPLTPDMIEAAACALAGYNSDYSTLEEGAEAIVRAALSCLTEGR